MSKKIYLFLLFFLFFIFSCRQKGVKSKPENDPTPQALPPQSNPVNPTPQGSVPQSNPVNPTPQSSVP